eukprot:TRINITY_DN7667_c0_g1_i1.p1 TRINITY_DN7667_c0_g1~~TRINITY_DN7667_c0_g1_i1.p1  ORF type:complete len:318 (+),score=68.94 TRINITY_DN7667_c0_g1_i1:78-1031(+)
MRGSRLSAAAAACMALCYMCHITVGFVSPPSYHDTQYTHGRLRSQQYRHCSRQQLNPLSRRASWKRWGGSEDEADGTCSNEADTRQQEQEHGEARSKAAEEGNDDDAIQLPQQDWRRFRAKLIAGSEEAWHERLQRNINPRLKDVETWAHELAAPEPGCLLLASPDHFTGQESQYSQAVIFLVQHNGNGSVGFVLNRPTQFTIGTVQMVHAFDAERMPGARKIIDGVYVGGGVLDAQEAVARGQAKPGDFKFFLQLFGKAPGHLQAEMDAGKWICAATSKELILKPCINLPVPLWREVLTLMGGKHSILGRLTYGDL